MEALRACRACLATDGKLYDIFANRLEGPFIDVVGSQLSSCDGLPQHLCSFCAALLLKTSVFQQRSRSAQNILLTATQHQTITTDYIKSLDRESYHLIHPYCTKHLSIKEEIKEDSLAFKEEKFEILNIPIDYVKLEGNSDEEPLAKVAKKRKKTKKEKNKCSSEGGNVKVTVKGESSEINESLFDNVDLCYEELNDSIYLEEAEPALEGDVKPPVECDGKLRDDDFEHEIEVTELTLEEQLQELRSRQSSDNYLSSPYKCEYCYRGFLLDTAFNSHMEKHDPRSGPHECGVCRLRYQSKHTLHIHTATAHANNYVCRRCGHVAKAKIKAKEHYRWHQGVQFPCEVCGINFSKRTTYLTHVRVRHPSKYVCDVCDMCFVSEFGLKMHWKKTHRSAQVDLRCVNCGTQFVNHDALTKHTGSATGGGLCDRDLKACYLCGDNFSNAEELKRHVVLHKEIECLECHKTYSNRRYYAAHYQRVHLLKKRDGKGDSKRYAKKHANVVCEVCGKKCKSKVTLTYHQRTHSGEKPYQCPNCPKKFSMQQRLQYHIRTHTGERPCQCPHCPKAFNHKAALNRHVRVHTGAKPYVCPHCSKGFSQSNSLKGHVRTVHLKLPALYRKSAAVDCSE